MNDMTSVCSVQTEDCDEEFWMTEVVLKVGEPAPDFALKDDHGCVRTLSNDCALMSEQVKDGKTRIRINRSTLLIDENGRLLKVMRGVAAREHVAELLQMLCSK